MWGLENLGGREIQPKLITKVCQFFPVVTISVEDKGFLFVWEDLISFQIKILLLGKL